jgi:hypothetical protein
MIGRTRHGLLPKPAPGADQSLRRFGVEVGTPERLVAVPVQSISLWIPERGVGDVR